jgi:hypothetical protein
MPLEESLSIVEQLIDNVSAALLAVDPQSLEQNSAALRDAAVQFAQLVEQASAPGSEHTTALKDRLSVVAAKIALHREGLARLSAGTDRQAAGLLPPNGSANTYEDTTGVRQAKSGVARIYRAAS